jgi:UPF0716 protein FxsA
MFSFRFLLLLFILVPFAEIYLLIEIGSVIGAPWTIFFVVMTAVIGAWLVRLQGLSALTRVQRSLDQGALPAVELLEGVFLLLAGALLLTPGFFTDAVGFALLTPVLRRGMVRYLLDRGLIRASGAVHSQRPSAGPGNTIEGEYRRVDE